MPSESDNPHAQGPPRSKRAAGYFIAIVLGGAAIAAVVAVALSGGGSEDATPTAHAFQPEYAELESRRELAGVSTMGDPEDASAHFHPRLAIYANGEQIPIPVNIGIDPNQPGQEMASLHTHETDGTIHVEGMPEPTLGQFFQIWGVPFSERELGPYEAEGEKTVRVWVDGAPSTEFEQLKLADGQEIVVAYGNPSQTPSSLTP